MSSWGEKDEISKEKLNLVACLFVCAYVCTHVRVLVCSRYLCTPACACTCAYGSVGAHWCTSVCVRALGAVRVQKGVCSNCRLVAIPLLTSRWRECSGKVKASGAVLRAGVERGDPGLESTLCGSGGWAVWPTLQAAPRRTSRASAAGLPPFLGDGQGWFLHPP